MQLAPNMAREDPLSSYPVLQLIFLSCLRDKANCLERIYALPIRITIRLNAGVGAGSMF